MGVPVGTQIFDPPSDPPSKTPTAAPSGPPAASTTPADELPQRRCGRCQGTFAGDPMLFFQTDWGLCPACAEILLPRHAPSTPGNP